MMEMACVSFNKVRLQYYVSKGEVPAVLLHELLNHSSFLFGTTLIGVNVALMVGSEFSRIFHSTLGISPDWAPISQVIIVVILGELAPMFAARRYPEHVVALGIRTLYYSSKIMTPLLIALNFITKLTYRLLGGHPESGSVFLTQEELQKLIAEGDEGAPLGGTEEFNRVISNIFSLRDKKIWQIMSPLSQIPLIPIDSNISVVKEVIKHKNDPFLLVYDKKTTNISGVCFPRDMILANDQEPIRNYFRAAWYITQESDVLSILKQFRSNQQTVAIVLNDKGIATGIVTLEDAVNEIFGRTDYGILPSAEKTEKIQQFIEKTFSAHTKIENFNKKYNVSIDCQGCETFAELIEKLLEHTPEEGDVILIPPFEIKVKEVSLLDIKLITIRTLYHLSK